MLLMPNNLGGVRPIPVPVDVDAASAILERHYVEASPRFGINVAVFRYVPSDAELGRASAERNGIRGIERVILNVYDQIRADFDGEDRVQVEVMSRDLNRGTVAAALVHVRDADPVFLINRMEQVVESNQQVRVDSGDFRVQVTHIPAIRGGGYESQRQKSLNSFTQMTEEALRRTRCTHAVNKKLDPFCAVACLLLGKEIADSEGEILKKKSEARWKRLNKLRYLRKHCHAICRQAGVASSQALSLGSVEKIVNRCFSDYSVIVYSVKTHMMPLCVLNESHLIDKYIYLLLDQHQHFHLITRLNAFLGKSGVYCHTCYKFFTGASRGHVCDTALCKQCKTSGCGGREGDQQEFIRCRKCLRGFYGRVCFERHLTPHVSPLFRNGQSTCQRVMACLHCNRDLHANGGVRSEFNAYDRTKRGKLHVCFKNRCRTCGEIDDLQNHSCYVRPLEPGGDYFSTRQRSLKGKNWFYDMETKQSYDPEREMYVFMPNLIVLKSETEDRHVFRGEGCLEKFCDFLFSGPDALANSNHHHRVFAHNGSRFDALFVLQGFCNVMTQDPSLIMEGTSPILLQWGKCWLLDTMKFIPGPLAG